MKAAPVFPTLSTASTTPCIMPTPRNARSSRRILAGSIAAAVVSVAAAQSAQAATIVDAPAPTSLNWNDAGNWTGGVVPGSTTGTTSADIASFTAAYTGGTQPTTAANALVIDTNRNISGITIDAPFATAIFIGTTGGNALLLSNAGTIYNHAGAVETINAPLVFEGATYTISSNNSGGTLNFGGSWTGNSTTATALTFTGDNDNVTNAINGAVSNGAGGALSMTFSRNKWNFTNASNTFSGTVSLANTNAPLIEYTGAGGNSGGGNYTVAGGTFLVNTTGTVAAGTIAMSGTGAFTLTSGTVTATGITNANTASNLNLNGGTLTVGASGITSTGGASTLNLAGGTLKGLAALNIGANLTIKLNTGASTIDTSGGNITASSAFLAGTGGTLTIQGGNTLTLPAGNTFTSATTITGNSTLALGGGAPTGVFTINAGSALDLINASSSIGGLAGPGTVVNTGSTALRTLTLIGAGAPSPAASTRLQTRRTPPWPSL